MSLSRLQELEDANWLRRSFMMPKRVTTHQSEFRKYTTGRHKFTDTTLGGNFAINPPPQFTRFADLKMKSAFSGSRGMGRYYSEALDDNGQYIHMRFGVPKFNSLTNFFFNFYNPQASQLARTGRGMNKGYSVGRALGFVITLPFQPIIWAGSVINFLAEKPVSKYYYLKPAMPLYWNAVSTMANMIGVNMGIISRSMSQAENQIRAFEPKFFEEDTARKFNENLGDIYRDDGGIDVYAMANRAQRLAHIQRNKMNEVMVNASGDPNVMWQEIKRKMLDIADEPLVLEDRTNKDMESYLKSYHNAGVNSVLDDESIDTTGKDGTHSDISGDAGFRDHAKAEMEDGSDFVTFRIDDPGPVSETFSTNVTESDIANKINSASSSGRSSRFSFANGNIAGDNVLGKAVQGALDQVSGFVTGTLDSINMSGLYALAGNAFVDIPKVWENSTANLPRSSYTIKLRSPYGNPRSRFQNLIIPLSMLLAAALPISTGKQSYTSPFLVQLFFKGRSQIRLGLIDSLSITRGTGNVGWTQDGEPLGIDVTFSVIDLTSVLHMPISANFTAIQAAGMAIASGAGAATGWTASLLGANTSAAEGASVAENIQASINKSNFDDDNAFTDYMAVLGSLSLADQIYPTNIFRIRRAQTLAHWKQWQSPAKHANWLFGSSPARLFRALTHQTNRQ